MMKQEYNIVIIGLGFIGLTTALGLAEVGHCVYGVDVNLERLAQIRSGQLPFAEPGVGEALERHLANGRFRVTDDAQAAARMALLICATFVRPLTIRCLLWLTADSVPMWSNPLLFLLGLSNLLRQTDC